MSECVCIFLSVCVSLAVCVPRTLLPVVCCSTLERVCDPEKKPYLGKVFGLQVHGRECVCAIYSPDHQCVRSRGLEGVASAT